MHGRKDGESIIKEKAFRKLGEAPEGTQCIDFPETLTTNWGKSSIHL
jgi:hypothetical protein